MHVNKSSLGSLIISKTPNRPNAPSQILLLRPRDPCPSIQSPGRGGSSEPSSNCFPNQGQSEADLTSTAPFPRSLVNNYFSISVQSSLKSGKTI